LNKNAEKLKKIKETSKAEWKNMPEYKFMERKPMRTLKINFETQEDLDAFEKLIGQKIRDNRNTYWYPDKKISLFSKMVYVDEEDES